jgi:glycosyltransferase involved in cell wall biosynthesis
MNRTLALKFQILVPSFQQQSELMKKALAPFYDSIIIPKTSLYGQRFTTWFVFTPALRSYLYQLAFSGKLMHAQRVMYITAEGIPNVSDAERSLLKGWVILAVSDFSKRMLEKAQIHVDGVVFHAIDEDEPYRCQEQAMALRKHYDELYKGRVLFAYSGSEVARKRVDLMIPAFRKAVEKSGNKIALISHSKIKFISGDQTKPIVPKGVALTNPYPVAKTGNWFTEENIFGHASHEYVTALHSACDFLLWSTCCEGFGVPPIEAMSCSKPVVAGKFAPNTEIMTDDSTIWYETPNVKYENYGLEQDFEMHYYNESAFVDAILHAVDIFINYKDSYREMCVKAKEQASKFDYRKVYGIELRKYLV